MFVVFEQVALTRDGTTLISGHFDGSVRFWSAAKGDSVRELTALHGKKQVTSVVLSSDGRRVLTYFEKERKKNIRT